MTRWFRFYDEALDDPKVQALSADDFRGWVNILCVTSKNAGRIPEGRALSFALRMSEIGAASLVDRLTIAGLIDRVKGGPNGSSIAPHNWAKRQYKSDTSTDRVKRFRKRYETATATVPETDTEAETEQKGKAPFKEGAFPSAGKKEASEKKPSRVFVEFDSAGWHAWAAYLRASGKIPKDPHYCRDLRKNGFWFDTPTPPEIKVVVVPSEFPPEQQVTA